jgi:hypothetical protein
MAPFQLPNPKPPGRKKMSENSMVFKSKTPIILCFQIRIKYATLSFLGFFFFSSHRHHIILLQNVAYLTIKMPVKMAGKEISLLVLVLP